MINVPKNVTGPEFDLYISGYKYCDALVQNDIKIADAINQTVEKYGFIISDAECFKTFLFSEVTAYTEPSIIISKEEPGETRDWWNKLKQDDSFSPQYWQRYYTYLNKKPAWSIKAITDIDDSTDELMNLISNPKSLTPEDKMGLVFGYVQSGKTAHYLGLINKAYDAGYRIIIVLSGIHNSLRSQTQSRIDEEVLGYETSLEDVGDFTKQKNAIGVGLGRHNAVNEIVQSVTTRDEKGDFCAKTEGISMVPPFVIVTKKNASVLRRIIRYFRKSPYAEVENSKKYISAKYPVLIIDDEADQASINTRASYDENGKILDDYNPTTINGLIRDLLQLFKIRTYVGYTATPFANIFIPPHIEDEHYGKDLFPRDFIVRAPRSDMYVGAREFFGLQGPENAPAMPLFEEITDGASFLGDGTKIDDPVGELPKELKVAIKFFLISTAIRNCRGQINKPNTMLVHIVRFVNQQNAIKKRIKEYFENEIVNYVLYGDNSIEQEFYQIWENNYIVKHQQLLKDFNRFMDGCNNVEWHDIWSEIRRLIKCKEILIYSVNGKSEDALLYKKNEGKPFNVIVVGGDKLSRGLTLEGLTVSYFTRGSNTYDTLMQMGRWFGYRPGYIDVCRLFTTNYLRGLFAHISMATEDLASQFEYMTETAHKSPIEFGLRVATHPDLEITSKNKLRTGEIARRDFSAKLSQTRVFDKDFSQFDRNFDAAETLLLSIQNYRISSDEYQNIFQRKNPGNHLFWHNVPAHDVISFFENYETSKTATRSNSKYMADYVRNMQNFGGLTKWTVCLINISNDHPPFSIAGIENIGAGIYREENHGVQSYATTCSIHTMTSEGHEYFDYSQADLNRVQELKATYSSVENKDSVNEFIRKRTRSFDKGLLLLYPIADAGELTAQKSSHPPFGFAAVFPDRKGKGNLQTYRMNDIALERDNNEFYI